MANVRAQSPLDVVAKFENDNLGLDIITYTNLEIAASPNRMALLGFRSTSARTSFVFSRNEWASLGDLWTTYDVVFLLNHFFEAVAGAVVEAGGMPNQFVGDGMMAIFGIYAAPREACRQALAAGQLIQRRLAEMNRTLANELPEPIAIGVGLHAGDVILGELGYRERFLLTAIGDSVHVAARLQDLTKDYGCQLVVSEVVATTAGIEMVAFPKREVSVYAAARCRSPYESSEGWKNWSRDMRPWSSGALG